MRLHPGWRSRFDAGSFDGKEVLLDDGCPDGANVRVATQDRDEVSLLFPFVFDLTNQPIQPKPDRVVVSFMRFVYSNTPNARGHSS